MLKLWVMLQSIRSKEEGQSLVEYGLIIALIAIVLIGALMALSGGLSGIFGHVNSTLSSTSNG